MVLVFAVALLINMGLAITIGFYHPYLIRLQPICRYIANGVIIQGITPHIFIIPIIVVITAVAIIANVVYYLKRRHEHGLNAL